MHVKRAISITIGVACDAAYRACIVSYDTSGASQHYLASIRGYSLLGFCFSLFSSHVSTITTDMISPRGEAILSFFP